MCKSVKLVRTCVVDFNDYALCYTTAVQGFFHRFHHFYHRLLLLPIKHSTQCHLFFLSTMESKCGYRQFDFWCVELQDDQWAKDLFLLPTVLWLLLVEDYHSQSAAILQISVMTLI